METTTIVLSCPYCEHDVETKIPTALAMKIKEVMCVPYTRDVGRFDPKTEEEKTSATKWSKIGKDYLPLINFERFGILRVPKNAKIDVHYRVQYCDNCSELFDAYVNCSENKLSEIWPEFFWDKEEKQIEGGEEVIKPFNSKKIDLPIYDKESWTIFLIRKIGKTFGSTFLGPVFIGLVLLIFGLIPWILPNHPAITANHYSLFLFCCVAYLISVIFVVIILFLYERYLRDGVKIGDLENLFKVKDRNNLIHWYNFTFCRYVGLQRKGNKPELSQLDVFTGGLSAGSVIITWAIAKHGWIFFLELLGFAFIWVGLAIFTHSVLEKKISAKQKRWVKPLILVSPILILFVYSVLQFIHLSIESQWFVLFDLSNLVFWLFVAYFIGTAALLALNSATYILNGVTRIPMKLSLMNDLSEMKPLLVIRKFSIRMMNSVFLFSISILSVLLTLTQSSIFTDSISVSAQIGWLNHWLRWILIIIFAVMTLSNKISFTGIMILLYIPLELIAIYLLPKGGIPGFPIILDWSLLFFGIFLSILKIYHTHIIGSIIKQFYEKTKKRTMEEVNQRIESLYRQLTSIQESEEESNGEFARHLTLVQTINEEIEFKKHLLKIDQDKKKFNWWNVILNPILWSLILPTIWNSLFQDTMNQLISTIGTGIIH